MGAPAWNASGEDNFSIYRTECLRKPQREPFASLPRARPLIDDAFFAARRFFGLALTLGRAAFDDRATENKLSRCHRSHWDFFATFQFFSTRFYVRTAVVAAAC
jgi:hypothetical protein